MSDRCRITIHTLNPDESTPKISHIHANKQITILDGFAELQIPSGVQHLFLGQTICIPYGHAHKIVNSGKIPLKYAEIRIGAYVKNDDILTI